MPDSLHLDHCSNLVGIAPACIANPIFNANPVPMRIAGTRESAHGLFDCLAEQADPHLSGQIFQDYMCSVFGFEAEQQLKADRWGRRRYRNSYLKLIQDWGLDSNNAQGAVLKGWVESRFGLFPNFHKQPIDGFMTPIWMRYIEEKMNSRYHNNCIYMQLDLLYEYCQWVIERFQFPAAQHKTLYRGVNGMDELSITRAGAAQQIIRFNNLVSFTDRRSIASEFGSHILEVKVPMVKLLFFSDLLPHHALHGEAEYLVIGGDYQVKVSH
jgi:NAD+---dinitrogen-reductase ADP-D-ribosyltransferase